MANDIISITDSGIASTNRDTIFNNLMNSFKAIYGGNVYIDKGTVDYNMISLIADLLSDMGSSAVSASNALNLTTAVGVQLDNIASIYYGDLTRRPATYSTVLLVITGATGATIVNGQVRDNFGGIWNLPETVTIPQGGTTNVTATYSQTGAYYIDANQISGASAIATPVSGWTNVSQPNECVVGSDVETDALFRARIAQKGKGGQLSTMDALISALYSVSSNITDVIIYENDTSETANLRSDLTNVPSHSIVPVVYFSGETPTQETLNEVGSVIYNSKSSGVGTYAPSGEDTSKTVNVSNSQGQVLPISFSVAETQSVSVNVSLIKLSTNVPDLNTEAETTIKNAIISAVNEYNIGDTIYAQNLYLPTIEAINTAVGINQFNISSITLTGSASSLVIPFNAKGVASTTTITINVV